MPKPSTREVRQREEDRIIFSERRNRQELNEKTSFNIAKYRNMIINKSRNQFLSSVTSNRSNKPQIKIPQSQEVSEIIKIREALPAKKPESVNAGTNMDDGDKQITGESLDIENEKQEEPS